MKKISIILASAVLFVCCQSNTPANDQAVEGIQETRTEQKITWNGYTKIKAMEIEENAVKLIAKDWMLITAGDEQAFNSMTASWGALGEIWSKPVFITTVRDTRYTHEFLEANDYYTLCFFDEEQRSKLELLGSKSGRDTDKVKESGLTPVATPKGSMAFAEARMIIECRKLYSAPFNPENFRDVELYNSVYGREPSMHTQYIGQIESVWVK